MSMSKIKNASYTKLSLHATCKYATRLKYLDKVPGPEMVPPPGKLEHPMKRGIRVHDEGEAYIIGTRSELSVEFRGHAEEMAAAKWLHSEGRATCEQMWRFDRNWMPLADNDWSAYWYIKLDLEFDIDTNYKGVVDFKTGKSYFNQVAHASQVQLYLVATLMRYPHVEVVTGELWYTDEKKVSRRFTLTRRQSTPLAKAWQNRALAMTECTVFPANPSEKNCRFCDYGANVGTGYCQFDGFTG